MRAQRIVLSLVVAALLVSAKLASRASESSGVVRGELESAEVRP